MMIHSSFSVVLGAIVSRAYIGMVKALSCFISAMKMVILNGREILPKPAY